MIRPDSQNESALNPAVLNKRLATSRKATPIGDETL